MRNKSDNFRAVCVTLWHSEKAGMNDPFGINKRLREMMRGHTEGTKAWIYYS